MMDTNTNNGGGPPEAEKDPPEKNVYRMSVFDARRMPHDRQDRAFWHCLYELWRLSWYLVHDRYHEPGPHFVSVRRWTSSVHRSWGIGDGVPSPPLTPEEVVHIGAGLIKAGFACTRERRSRGDLVYQIQVPAAADIQRFLYHHIADRRLAPSAIMPGVSSDLAAATFAAQASSTDVVLHYRVFSPTLVVLHEYCAGRALARAVRHASRKRRRTQTDP